MDTKIETIKVRLLKTDIKKAIKVRNKFLEENNGGSAGPIGQFCPIWQSLHRMKLEPKEVGYDFIEFNNGEKWNIDEIGFSLTYQFSRRWDDFEPTTFTISKVVV